MEFFNDLVGRLQQQVDPALLGEEITQDEVRQLAATVAYIILDAMADGVVDEHREAYLELARAGIVEGVMLSDCEGSESHAH
jgi:hypothetical protein